MFNEIEPQSRKEAPVTRPSYYLLRISEKETCDIDLSNFENIPALCLRIDSEKGNLLITSAATNSIQLNESPIDGKCEYQLKDGDILTIDQSTIIFRFVPSEEILSKFMITSIRETSIKMMDTLMKEDHVPLNRALFIASQLIRIKTKEADPDEPIRYFSRVSKN